MLSCKAIGGSQCWKPLIILLNFHSENALLLASPFGIKLGASFMIVENAFAAVLSVKR